MSYTAAIKSQQDEWMEALKAKGHTPATDGDGSLNYFLYDQGYHNGPGCSSCGWSTCWHCDGLDVIPTCTHPATAVSGV